jgi:hypothetical protein
VSAAQAIARGWQVLDAAGRRMGTVDAVFADYLLVRTSRLLPVDLYVPMDAIRPASDPETVTAEAENERDAYQRWHRPLKRAPHD